MGKDLSKYKVALVVGHCLGKQGAVNKASGVTEYAFNKKVVETVAPLVSKFCECYIVFREDNVGDEVRKVNDLNPTIAFSFHSNAYNTEATGSEVLYYSYSSVGGRIASIMLKHICSALQLTNRGVRAREAEDRGGSFLKNTKCYSVIMEPFFIDNNSDFKRANDNFKLLCEEINNGIRECLELLESGKEK